MLVLNTSPTYIGEAGFRFTCLNLWKFTDYAVDKFVRRLSQSTSNDHAKRFRPSEA
jgi:hypothetical protein